jgi:hypothetical protein
LVPVKTDVSEEGIGSIIREERISELGTALAVAKNWMYYTKSIFHSTLKSDHVIRMNQVEKAKKF